MTKWNVKIVDDDTGKVVKTLQMDQDEAKRAVLEWVDRVAADATARGCEAMPDPSGLISFIHAAAESGAPWTAAQFAMTLITGAALPEWIRGIKNRAQTSAGGLATRKEPPDAQLVAEVRAMHESNERNGALSWSQVCVRVGERHGICRRTVAERAKAADWRTK